MRRVLVGAVIVLRYHDDLTESQAADVLGCRIGTVKRHAHEASASSARSPRSCWP